MYVRLSNEQVGLNKMFIVIFLLLYRLCMFSTEAEKQRKGEGACDSSLAPVFFFFLFLYVYKYICIDK